MTKQAKQLHKLLCFKWVVGKKRKKEEEKR